MFGILGKLKKGFTLYNAVKNVIDEGKDVVVAVAKIRSKYDQLDDDLKEAFDEVVEFVDAIKKVV
jgi:hypothetical protein